MTCQKAEREIKAHEDFMAVLHSMGVCDEAIEWVMEHRYTLRQAYNAVEKVGWLSYFIWELLFYCKHCEDALKTYAEMTKVCHLSGEEYCYMEDWGTLGNAKRDAKVMARLKKTFPVKALERMIRNWEPFPIQGETK